MKPPPTYGTPRFFLSTPLQANARIALDPHAAHHAARVLRLREGDAVVLFDGTGGQYPGRIDALSGKAVSVLTGEFDPVERESPLSVTLVQGLSSADRMDYTMQKAVELGAAAVDTVVAEKSVVRLAGERAEARAGHWQRIAIAACEQCGRNRLPVIRAPLTLERWLAQPAAAGLRLLALPGAGTALADALAGHAPSRPITVAVGPEAGFSERENTDLLRAGFLPVHLGPRVLRTETVAPALLAAINALCGDWR